MKISKHDLIQYETEVDMPVWGDGGPITPKTICFDRDSQKFVLKIIKTGEIVYSCDMLEELVEYTNAEYDYDDEVTD